ncbi:hypothetical protein ACQP2P_11565 [Dactylosporangium sp. CA-139114]|uniref:hypothetical protein n=1 Tax=Dactylosporangium sp. CA-139114 TaxID=3239931 RepID=UPI003D982809
MTERDPLVPALTGLVVDLLWWLDSCNDDEIDPDTAVKMMESVSWVLHNLPSEQRQRFMKVLDEMAAEKEHAGRRQQLLTFAYQSGLVDDEPAAADGEPTPWVHPAARVTSES